MENMTQEAQVQQVAPEHMVKSPTPGECPTCISGLDPTIGTDLFQEALRESL
jgi:hypothetical protein